MILSVIIPCYNCASVIQRCLDSIDYPDAEIIVVDDGSKDNSAQVVEDYALRHPNVSLVKKENGGVSSARNLGIEKATGKYLMFLDADDYLGAGGIERVVELAEKTNADVVKFWHRTLSSESPQMKENLCSFAMTNEVIEGRFKALLRNDVSDYLVWDGVYLRSVITDNHIRFHTDLHLHEDDVFMGELYCHTQKVVTTNLPLYRYVMSSAQSSTHNQSVERQKLLIESGYLAIEHRGSYVEQHCPEAMPLERLKYMRWVCRPKTAIEAGYSLKEYRAVLKKFGELGCWPLDYNWMHVARLDWSWKNRMKNRMRTFLCNHPGLAYVLYGLKILR